MRARTHAAALLLALIAAAFGPPCRAEDAAAQGMAPAQVISWRDAAGHVGKYRCVEGRVASTKNTGRTCFLNFDPRRTFTVVIFSRSFARFPGPPERIYRGKAVRVWGQVETYRGRPQIVVSHPQQIQADGLAAPARSPAAADRIRIATYNVHNFFDGHDDPFTADEGRDGKPLATSREDLRALCAVIRDEVRPDVLALQEVENRGLLRRTVDDSLADLGYQHVVLVEGNDGRGIDVALLSRFPVVGVTTFQHLRFRDAIGLERRFARDALRVEVIPRPGLSLLCYVLHLKSRHGGADASHWRHAEAKQLRSLVEADCARGAKVLVLGDFNDDADSDTLRILRGPPGAAALTPVDAADSSGRRTTCYSKGYPPIRFDYVLLSPALAKHVVAGSARVVDTAQAAKASDHRPVVVEIDFAGR